MSGQQWEFRLYVAGQTPLGQRALANLRSLVDRHLPDGATIEVVDLREDPDVAVTDRILAVPTVVRVSPEPEARLVGDLSDPVATRRGLDLPPVE